MQSNMFDNKIQQQTTKQHNSKKYKKRREVKWQKQHSSQTERDTRTGKKTLIILSISYFGKLLEIMGIFESRKMKSLLPVEWHKIYVLLLCVKNLFINT